MAEELKETPEKIEEETKETVETKADEKTASKEDAKKVKAAKKKNGLWTRIKRFFKNMKSELKRVTWFSRKQTYTSTRWVIVCIAVTCVVLGLLDYGLSAGLEGLASLF